MRTLVRIVCFGIALAWMQGVVAGEVTVSEQGDAIVLESLGGAADTPQAASAPAAAPGAVSPAPELPPQAAPSSSRVTVKPHYEKVDRANIEKRIADRAARTKKRSMDAEKDAAERAAKAQANQTPQQDQGTPNSQ